MTALVECDHVSKAFGRLQAVDDVSFTVTAGELVGFIGPNGAGKSTTVRLLLGGLRPTTGTALLFVAPTWRDASMMRRVGYLPGDFRLEPKMTGWDLFGWFDALRGTSDRARLTNLIERLDAQPDKPYRSLSKGNRQKLGIVAALVHRPEVVILDEPTTGLDPLVQREFLALVVEAATGGAAVLLSSHILPEVERVAGRLVIIRAGRIVDDLPTDDLLDRARQHLDLRYDAPVNADSLRHVSAVSSVDVHGRDVLLTIDGPVGPALRAALELGTLQRVRSSANDLEDVFLSYYEKDEAR